MANPTTSVHASPPGDRGTPTRHPLPVGHVLGDGRYRIEGVRGRGGFGITYRALDERLERVVAVKELFPEGARRDGVSVVVPGAAVDAFARARQRFLREARVLAQFDHPAIVRIYAAFEAHGTAYLVLEMLPGETLAAELRQRGGPFGQAEALEVTAQAAMALGVIHRAGVLHRDVSPSNLVRAADGRVVLIDFGLARPFEADHTEAMTRIVTPGYAPPEQYQGEARFGPRADVYALGATLYRLLTARTPAAAVDREHGTPMTPPWRINPTVDRAVSDAVVCALALDPADRPADVDDLLDRLGVGSNESPTATPPTISRGPDGGADGALSPEATQPASASELFSASPDASPSSEPPSAFVPTEVVQRSRIAPQAGPADHGDGRTDLLSERRTEADVPGRIVARRVPESRVPESRVPGRPPPPRAYVPAPDQAPAFAAAPAPVHHGPRDGERRAFGAGDGRAPWTVGAAPPGRAWLTLPLGVALVGLASAQPVPVLVLVALAVAPALATSGDRVLRPHKRLAWLPVWFARNVVTGAARVVGPVALVFVGVCLWYGTRSIDALAPAGPWVLRATGVGAGWSLALGISRGSPVFHSQVALDAASHRFVPRGRPTVPAIVVSVFAVLIGLSGLAFQPEVWPLPR